ncbi:hypothetical protein ZWY2020_041285 [Hordeum vulgare]|nr:hypothetical protein ZWY2020_041285 [Hordeum vulgare]
MVRGRGRPPSATREARGSRSDHATTSGAAPSGSPVDRGGRVSRGRGHRGRGRGRQSTTSISLLVPSSSADVASSGLLSDEVFAGGLCRRAARRIGVAPTLACFRQSPYLARQRSHANQKEPEPNAMELLKDCCTSKIKGRTTTVNVFVVITLFTFIRSCLNVSLHVT